MWSFPGGYTLKKCGADFRRNRPHDLELAIHEQAQDVTCHPSGRSFQQPKVVGNRLELRAAKREVPWSVSCFLAHPQHKILGRNLIKKIWLDLKCNDIFLGGLEREEQTNIYIESIYSYIDLSLTSKCLEIPPSSEQCLQHDMTFHYTHLVCRDPYFMFFSNPYRTWVVKSPSFTTK